MLLTLSSCNDWLDEVKQTTTVSDEIIWQDETQVDKYVNSFYPMSANAFSRLFLNFTNELYMEAKMMPSNTIIPTIISMVIAFCFI